MIVIGLFLFGYVWFGLDWLVFWFGLWTGWFCFWSRYDMYCVIGIDTIIGIDIEFDSDLSDDCILLFDW